MNKGGARGKVAREGELAIFHKVTPAPYVKVLIPLSFWQGCKIANSPSLATFPAGWQSSLVGV